MGHRKRDREQKQFGDPWLESIFNTPAKKAKLSLAVTIAYIVLIFLMITGIMVVILYSFFW